MGKIEGRVSRIAAELAEPLGLTVERVEYVNETGNWFLKVFISKEDKVSVKDCEALSRVLSRRLDDDDFIEGSYFLEVSSCGIDLN